VIVGQVDLAALNLGVFHRFRTRPKLVPWGRRRAPWPDSAPNRNGTISRQEKKSGQKSLE
jgi:hypothetical protein